MSRAIIYLRVSTEEQAEKGYSLYAQKEECLEKVKALNCNEILEFSDEGVSGSILERPMLLNALEALKQQAVDYFVCYDPSRLSRNVSHQLILIDSIKKYKAKLVFVRSNYDDTAEGRFQITIMAAVDEFERARLKIRTELGKRTKAKSKLLTHNPNIYGYKFDKETDSLKIHEEQSTVVNMMFEWLLHENLGPSRIADRLNDLNIPSMRGKQWSRVSVNRILKNFSYTGTIYIRRYDTRDCKLNKFKKDKEKVKVIERPQEQWVGIEIPAIISVNTWQEAKILLDKSKRIYKKEETFLLSGLLTCGHCGGTLFAKGSSENRYYCCSNKYNYNISPAARCSSRLYKAEKLEEAVWQKIKPWLMNEKEMKKLIANKSYYNEDTQTNIKDLVIEAYKEKEKIKILFQKSYINESEMDSKISEIDKRINFINKCKANKESVSEIDIADIEKYITYLTMDEKNKILCRIIKEIILEDGHLLIKTAIPKYIAEKC